MNLNEIANEAFYDELSKIAAVKVVPDKVPEVTLPQAVKTLVVGGKLKSDGGWRLADPPTTFKQRVKKTFGF